MVAEKKKKQPTSMLLAKEVKDLKTTVEILTSQRDHLKQQLDDAMATIVRLEKQVREVINSQRYQAY